MPRGPLPHPPHPVRVRIYDFIIRYKSAHDGNSPSIREIGAAVGISATSHVAYHLDRMVSFGMITRASRNDRNITVIGGKWIGPNMLGRS